MISLVLALLSPIAVTVAAFLILYNNVSAGRIILLVLMLGNLAAILVPTRNRPWLKALGSVKPAAGCLVAGLAAVLAIELAFPVFSPNQYAWIRDLTKQWTGDTMQVDAEGAVLFTNPDQRMGHIEPESDNSSGKFKHWHAAGCEFAYYGYDPNSRLRYVNLLHWNSRGYFDNDYETRRPEGTKRIVVIGDSYVEAVQVPLARTFHKLLESELNSGSAGTGSEKYEVVAIGSSGTGQRHHLRKLRQEGLAFNPQMVVIALCSNDFCDDDPELKDELVLASGAITPMVRGLAEHGYFAPAFALRRFQDLRRNRIEVSPELLQWTLEDIPRVEAAWARTLGYVREARDVCRQHGIPFVLVYLGSDLEVKYAIDPLGTVARLKAMGGPHKTIAWDMEKSVRRVTAFCQENGIPLISLLDPLVEAQKETGNQVFGDHYTLFGHQVVAQVLRCALGADFWESAGNRASFAHCMSPDAWGPVAPVVVVAAPGHPSEATFVTAAGPGPKSR